MPRVGRHHVIEQVRASEIARAYLAYEVTGGIVRPVELLRAANPAAERLLVEGATIAAQLDHPNLERIVDLDQDTEGAFVVRSAILGRPLSELLDRSRATGVAIDPNAAMYIAMQVLAGLVHAHQHPLGVIHRDVHPEAIRVGYSGEVRLTDFAYAQSVQRPSPPTSPRVVGPEQAGGVVDARADIYGVGLVLWSMLAGRDPDRVEPLREVAPHVPPALAMTIDRALLADPNQRQPTAEVFRDELARMLYSAEPTYAGSRLASLLGMVLASEAAEDRRRDQEARRDLGASPRSFSTPAAMTPVPSGYTDSSEVLPVPMYGMPPSQPPAPLPNPLARAETAQLAAPPPLDDRSLPVGKILVSLVAVLIIAGAVFTLWSDRNTRLVSRKLREAFVGRNPGGTLTIESIPPGAFVTLDDEATEKKTPLTIENLESQVTHFIELTLPGEKTVTSTLAITAGQKKTLNLVFEGAVVSLAVKSEPEGAELWLDGNNVAFTPTSLSVRTDKEVKVEVKKLGYLPFEKTLTPQRGSPVEMSVLLEKSPELLEQEAMEAAALKAMEEEKRPKKRKRRRRRR